MSIDRNALHRTLAELTFEPGRWVVAGSAPMLLAGLIDSIDDIDIVVDRSAWRQAVSLSDQEPEHGRFGDHIVKLEMAGSSVEVFDGWLGTNAAQMLAEAVDVDGVPCSPLGRVLDSKRRLGRPRDLHHIRIIESHVDESQMPMANSQQPSSD